MVKNILATVLGLLVSFVIIFAAEIGQYMLHPFPPDFNMADPEQLKIFSAGAPSSIFVVIIIGYALSSFVGGIVAARIAANNKMSKAITVGGVLMGYGAYNLFMIPHPIWTIIISLFVFIPCSYFGGALGIKWSGKKLEHHN